MFSRFTPNALSAQTHSFLMLNCHRKFCCLFKHQNNKYRKLLRQKRSYIEKFYEIWGLLGKFLSFYFQGELQLGVAEADVVTNARCLEKVCTSYMFVAIYTSLPKGSRTPDCQCKCKVQCQCQTQCQCKCCIRGNI